eukprot:s3214_g11.t1
MRLGKQRFFCHILPQSLVSVQLQHKFAVTQVSSHPTWKTFQTHCWSSQNPHGWIGSEFVDGDSENGYGG